MPVMSKTSVPSSFSDAADSPSGELQRDDAHADQVGAVDAFERLGDDRADAQQAGALGRPVPRRPRPVLLAAQHDQRNVLRRIVLCGVEDERLSAKVKSRV